jgi:alkaline phosphatase D
VHFVVTDLRSERFPAKSHDGLDKTMVGTAQKEWFKRELLAAKSRFALIFWVRSVPWTGKSHTGDGGAAFPTERQEIADFIKVNGIRIYVFSLATRTCSARTTGATATSPRTEEPRCPGFKRRRSTQASFKGGPYSHGYYLPERGEGCFGLVEVHDGGREINAFFTGRNHRDEKKVSLSFAVAEDGGLRCSPPPHK